MNVRLERALAGGEAQYHGLAESLPDMSVLRFDPDLRLIFAAGEALAANGHPGSLAGMLMSDAFPPAVLDLLQSPCHAALVGQSSDFTYASPVSGRLFQARARPVFGFKREVIGALLAMQDVTADRVRAIQLDQIQQFSRFGGSSYDRRSGWAYDRELLELWGIDDTSRLSGLPVQLLTPEERAASSHLWSTVLTENGPHSLSYSLIHPLTGQRRYMGCATLSVVDSSGALLRVVASHVDVSDVVAAGRRAEEKQVTAGKERALLLRHLGDTLATSRLGPDQLLRTIVDLASATLGEGAAIRIMSPDHRTIERDVIAHPDESIRGRLAASLHRSALDPVPHDGMVAEVVGKGKLLSDIRQRDWLPEYQQIFTERVFDDAAHAIVAPVRHHGAVLGKLAVFRTNPGAPYLAGDDDVLQVLADGAGAAISENRVWQQADRERDERLIELRKQHLELLEQLAGMETRERSLLADAIHDEPIQRIVAAVLRLDQLITRMDPATRSEVNDIAEQLVATVSWLRDLIVVALTPPDLAAGLGPALAALARSIFTATPTVFTVIGLDHVPLAVPVKEAIYRIFREALSNVRKHAHAKNATLRVVQQEGLIVISLTDDGVGSTSLDAGTGHFGMATMRARADAEGGQLHIESAPGLGTAVTLTLSVLPAPAITGPPDGVPRSSPVDLDFLRTIVVCDDHEYLREAVKSVLSNVPRFHVVGEAFDGDTCLERVRNFRPDVLILDVSMPGGGPDLARAAKELNPGMHIVVFSGRQDDQTRNEMLAAGADEYIVKTGRLQPLVEALDRVIAAAQEAHPGRR